MKILKIISSFLLIIGTVLIVINLEKNFTVGAGMIFLSIICMLFDISSRTPSTVGKEL